MRKQRRYGYSGKRRRRRKKQRRLLKFLAAVLILLGAWQVLPEEWTSRGPLQELEQQAEKLLTPMRNVWNTAARRLGLNSESRTGQSFYGNTPVSGVLQVTFLDVGQGDCTLIRQGEHAMLFDCGPDDRGTYIQNFLEKQGIDTLDYVIASHPDEDHIGSMDVIVTKFDCQTILMMETQKDTRTVRDVQDAIRYKGYETVSPKPGEIYELGEARFQILAPIWDYGDDSNNNSIVIRLEYGNTSFLFTGDAEKEEEQDMVADGAYLKSDVYQAGHHGSSNASSRNFLEAVRPAYTVISCGAENDYGHPHAETLQRLQEIGSEIFRTDWQGTVQAVSDGENISWTSS